ncbi:MAG: helix-hairpin-helix domain-containing protein [Prevotellaceae bacterium]|jgi:hypothetical protein|nr:helix-hairpin-helix domain-containing protein [Prevotellaceae bacterium]
MRILWTSIFLILFLPSGHTQDKDLSALISDMAESVADKAEDEDEITGMEQLVEHYTYLAENPLNINSSTAGELSQLMVLTDFQIFSISEYIKEYGALMSVHELLLVPGFDEETVSRISPFVITSVPERQSFNPSFKDMLTKGYSALLTRSTRTLETRKGYTHDDSGLQRYEGSPFSFFMRYKYKHSNRLQIGLTADKDAGEEFFRGSNRQGFDFYSFHLMINDRKYVKKLIIGDFRANFGQGLAMWNNFAFNKSADVHSIKRRNNGFSAYSSADEVTFMRGIASTLQFGSWEFSPFVSYRKIDATMEGGGYTSLSANGMHRTPNEISRKNTLSETVIGINAGYGKTFWRIGATALYGRYGAEDYRDIRPYSRFNLHKPSNANFAVDYRLIIKSISLFGEAAISSNGGKALLAGITADVNHMLQFSSLYRNYQTYYQAVYSNAFGENSNTANERGIYFGVSILPHKSWKISAFIDSYYFPWLRYGVDSPSSGWDYLVQANYTPNKNFDVRIKIQHDKAVKNLSGSTVSSTQDVERTRALLQAAYSLSPELSMNSRLAFSFFNPEIQSGEKGFLMSQDIKYRLRQIPLSFALRYAIFDTDGWNSRLYVYESDILYAFSVPAYSGKGCRYYLNTGYKITDKIQLWFRISQTYYFDRTEISSGLSTIAGNRQTDAKLQVLVKF